MFLPKAQSFVGARQSGRHSHEGQRIALQLMQRSAKSLDKAPRPKETRVMKTVHGVCMLEEQVLIFGIEAPGHRTGGSQEARGQMRGR